MRPSHGIFLLVSFGACDQGLAEEISGARTRERDVALDSPGNETDRRMTAEEQTCSGHEVRPCRLQDAVATRL